MFFFMVQSEFGDLYQVRLDVKDGSDTVTNLRIKYFDTIPVTNSLCISKRGFLFAASEFGDQCVVPEAGGCWCCAHGALTPRPLCPCDAAAHPQWFLPVHEPGQRRRHRRGHRIRGGGGRHRVVPRAQAPRPDQLEPAGRDPVAVTRAWRGRGPHSLAVGCAFTPGVPGVPAHLSQLMQLHAADLAGEGSGEQLYALCGRGTRSSLRVLRHGLAVTEMAANDMPGNPMAVWTVPASQEDPNDRYIVVSFLNATLVLEVGETVEETTESGFLASSPTVAVQLLADNAILQVHKTGIRHIKVRGWPHDVAVTVANVQLTARCGSFLCCKCSRVPARRSASFAGSRPARRRSWPLPPTHARSSSHSRAASWCTSSSTLPTCSPRPRRCPCRRRWCQWTCRRCAPASSVWSSRLSPAVTTWCACCR